MLSRGDHRAAAIGCEEIGDLSRARSLYEGLFDYKSAGRLAEMQGDALGALELYLKSGEVQLAEAVRRALMADLSDDLPAALALYERRGFTLQAGELAESIGRMAQAAELYIKASNHKRAGALLERLGRLREAGEAYEKSLVGLPDDPEANLGLGRVLQRFGRHKEALRLLCVSAQEPAFVAESARRIACAFFKLGFLESGRTALELAGLPRGLDPDDFVRPFEDELQHELEAGAHGTGQGASASGALEGRYRMEKPLGGRIGATFLGRDLLNDAPVVLRFFPGSVAENAEYYDELERLKNTRLAGHVRVLEINREGGFVVTEFVEGQSLLGELRSESPPNALRCRGYALQILDAVGAAHQVGVLHGALSPASIRIAPGGACLVDDWGVRHIEKRMATQTGGEESTFAYRAPELNIGRGADLRADLYAVAAILYRALVGQAPVMGRGAEGLEGWPAPFAEFFAVALDANAAARHPSHDRFRRALQALPWNQVAQRALSPPAPVQAVEEGRGPRFVCDRPPAPGERVTARDTLLGRDVRLLKLPDERELSAHLIDRLTALAGPEVPVFQDILRFDVEEGAIVLEVMKGEPVRSIVARQGAIEPSIALEAGEPLLAALAAAHAGGVGLGQVNPDTIVFDGDGLRAPIEGALLKQELSQTQAIAEDARGYWEALLLVTEGAPSARPGPKALIQVLLRSGHLLPVDVQPLTDQIPASEGSLAAFPGWFDELRRAVDACLARRAVLDRLERVVAAEHGANDLASAWLAQRRRALGMD